MTAENTTAGDATQWAKHCAERAQHFQEALECWRLENLKATTERGFSAARVAELEKTAVDMARARDEMISLANMWANVSQALYRAEGRGEG
ncbi:hypothetical protein [Streptomyces sp. CL12-4]|uniref:hypothetical protein n=1 Tax=Streptomyces sp. CL12-4 TaxID=2810306 RepID=UPI001EFB0E1E|nr:hypothetical protein [Streptomyces sp. CL12-4]MCG8971785.1 hypothetical protein [Streptomyces sp. CL12-4]